MRMLCTIALFFLLSFEKTQAQITITGQIKNAPDSTEVLIYYFDDLIRSQVIVIGNSLLDESGVFNYNFDLKQKVFGHIKIGEQFEDLYLCPGDEIIINSEYNNFNDKLEYISKYKAEQEYLHLENVVYFIDKIKPAKTFKTADLYKKNVEAVEIENLKAFNQYLNRFKDPYFIDFKRNEIKYKYIHYKALIVAANKFNKFIPDSYFNFIDSVNLNHVEMINSSYYMNAVSTYLYVKYGRFVLRGKEWKLMTQAEKRLVMESSYEIRKNKLTSPVRDLMLSEYVKYNLQDVKSDTAFVNKILKDYYKECANKEFSKYIKDLNTKISKQNGSIIANYEFYDIYSTKQYLHSLKGKYIYIDFWASWCYPCKVNLKDYPNLKAKYADRNDIVYLFINVMDDKNNWSDYVLNNPNYGINWFADKATTKKLKDYFNLDAIPRYMIIDKNLKIIDVDAEIPKNVTLP